MSSKDVILVIKKPHFTVKLHESVLEVDLKKGLKKELEDVLEAKPILRENLGFLFQTVIPLDVALKHIESVGVDKKGQVKISIPHRRDIIIPLARTESKKLVDKLNELIPVEKQRELERLQAAERARAEREAERAKGELAAEELRRRPR